MVSTNGFEWSLINYFYQIYRIFCLFDFDVKTTLFKTIVNFVFRKNLVQFNNYLLYFYNDLIYINVKQHIFH